MGRSVGYVYNVKHAFFHYEINEDIEYEMLVEDLQYSIKGKYKSLYFSEKWHDREGRIILENDHCQIVLYQYYSLFSINVLINPKAWDYGTEKLAGHWIEQVFPGIVELLPNQLKKVATASNGEAFFERV